MIVTAPTRLVTTEQGDSTLTTGDGIVPDFKEGDNDENVLTMTFEEKRLKDKGKKKGLKKQKKKIQTDQDRKKAQKVFKIQEEFNQGILIVENDGDGKGIVDESSLVNEDLNQTIKDMSNDGIDDGILNMEK